MRANEKIKSGGYSYKTHHFNGWLLQEKMALKWAHPSVIRDIQQELSKRN